MYNQNLKEEFIAQYTNKETVIRLCEYTFQLTEEFENKWGADLCTRSVDELNDLAHVFGNIRRQSDVTLRIARAYARWCIDRGVPGASDGLLKLPSFSVQKMRDRMVSSPLHMQKCLDTVFDNEEEETNDNTFRCYCWLAFMGVPEEEIPNVLTSEVDFDDMVVRHNTVSYEMYRESLRAFRNCVKLTQFRWPHQSGIYFYRNRAAGKELIRGVHGVPDINSMRAILVRKINTKRKQGGSPHEFSYNRIWLSGVFYRTYEQERAGVAPDFSAVAANFMEGKEYKLKKGGKTLKSKQNEIAKGFLKDYNNWKSVFS